MFNLGKCLLCSSLRVSLCCSSHTGTAAGIASGLLLGFAVPSVILQPSLASLPPAQVNCVLLPFPPARVGSAPGAPSHHQPFLLWGCRCFVSSLGLLSFPRCAPPAGSPKASAELFRLSGTNALVQAAVGVERKLPP